MKQRFFFATLFAATSFMPLTPVEAAPTGDQICRKMIADGRGGGLSQKECLCRYRAAEAVLDDDFKALLFDSWLNGTNNMAAVENLPRQGRVRKQMLTLKRTAEKNCTGI